MFDLGLLENIDLTLSRRQAAFSRLSGLAALGQSGGNIDTRNDLSSAELVYRHGALYLPSVEHQMQNEVSKWLEDWDHEFFDY
jgi:hypothetical protein